MHSLKLSYIIVIFYLLRYFDDKFGAGADQLLRVTGSITMRNKYLHVLYIKYI